MYIFPAYAANAIPVILGGGQSLDFGRTFKDGQPILGSHKTIRGFLAGLIVGTLVGIGEGFVLGKGGLILGFALSLGALTGDLLGAFVKRRLKLPPGALMPAGRRLRVRRRAGAHPAASQRRRHPVRMADGG